MLGTHTDLAAPDLRSRDATIPTTKPHVHVDAPEEYHSSQNRRITKVRGRDEEPTGEAHQPRHHQLDEIESDEGTKGDEYEWASTVEC